MLKQKLTIFISILGLFLPLSLVSAGTIVSPYKYAWSNNVGYINFASTTVSDSTIGGYAWSANKGWINMSPAQGGVSNDGTGNLSGSAWGEQLGWIDFDNVSINPVTGKFSGTASGSLVGTITFDCDYCDVRTDWRQVTTPPAPPSGGGGGGGGGGGIFSSSAITSNISNQISNIISSIVPPTETSAVKPALFDISLSSEGLRSSAAPGESIAFSVKLVNFGSQKRADVTINYRLLDSEGQQVYAEQETVAVDTTASFVKRLPIPKDAKPGSYTIESSLAYTGQKAPAVSRFTFTVLTATAGQSRINISFIAGAAAIAIFLALLAGLFIRRRRQSRLVAHDYSDKPKSERIYYEIISDTIGQMRQRVGDSALEVAKRTTGLVINETTGRVLKITDSPARVVAGLVSGYEQSLGKKVSFSLRPEKTEKQYESR